MLILAATPIGNVADASPRLQQVLREADTVFAEDTRHAARLLQRLGIDRSTRAFHDHSEAHVLDRIGQTLTAGKTVVYISDAGMPGINDPGYELVRLARERDVPVDVVPGPSAVINALVLSGLPSHEFCFLGFFPTTPVKRARMLDRLEAMQMTAVFFEGPSRIVSALEWLTAHAPDTEIAVCREMTKLHQEVLTGTPASVAKALEMVKGEFCLVIGPVARSGDTDDLEGRFEALLAQGERPSKAIRLLAKETGLSKRAIGERLGRDL